MLSFREFSKRFGERTAVDRLTLDVARGEIVALLGPNGSGKTTSLKAAAGLINPSHGSVLVGEPLRSALEPEARFATAYLPQRVSFPPQLNGREVVQFFAAIRGTGQARVDQALKFASLNGASARPAGTYSGGMTKRLGLAVASVSDAPLLLLDEPTAALDQAGLSAFYELIEQRRAAGQTVVFTSHQMGDIERLADRLCVLVEGKLVATFTARELAARLANHGVMKMSVDLDSLYRELVEAPV